MQNGQAVTSFAQKLGEHALLHEPAGAGIQRVHRELQRHQHRINHGLN